MATPSHLTGLPVELQRDIIDYIKASPDLKALCLVCKAFHSYAAPKLYRDLVLPPETLTKDLPRSLNRSNVSLRHTRRLRISDPTSPHHRWYDHPKHGEHLVHLIQSIPKDILERIDLHTQEGIPLDVTALMQSRQRNLCNYLLFYRTDPDIKPSYMPQADDLANIVSLTFTIGDIVDCNRGSRILRNVHHPRDLSLLFTNEFQEEFTPQIGFVILFAEWTGTKSSRPKLALRRLYLNRAPCEEIESTLTSALDVRTLATLELYMCWRSDYLLGHFSRQGMNLTSLVQYYDSWEADDDEPDTLETFVRSQSNLKEFLVTPTENEDVQYWKAEMKCGTELRILGLDDIGACGNSLYPGDFIRSQCHSPGTLHELCAACPNLEQLAIHPPPPSKDSDHFDADSIGTLTACLKNLKQLVSVRLYIWPGEGKKAQDLLSDTSKLHPLLQSKAQWLADSLFSNLRDSSPRFVALAIDILKPYGTLFADGDCKKFEEMSRLGYLRDYCFGEDGNVQITGRPVALHRLRAEEPCNDIFKDDFFF